MFVGVRHEAEKWSLFYTAQAPCLRTCRLVVLVLASRVRLVAIFSGVDDLQFQGLPVLQNEKTHVCKASRTGFSPDQIPFFGWLIPLSGESFVNGDTNDA